jgi:branched-chain amino acid transport system ATP-binding protein
MGGLLDVERLCSGYGRTQVLRDVSVRVDEGEIVALVGANGAGKSTLVNTIAGTLPTISGVTNFAGQPVTGLATSGIIRRGLVLVPERRQLFTDMSVHENLLLGSYSRRDVQAGDVRSDIALQYEAFPILAMRRHQLAGKLSGGEQQMLAIARGMMARPRMLMLDEPSLGLAPRLVRQMFALVQTLAAKGVSVLLIEQNASSALEIAQRGYVLETGRVVLCGPASELSANPHVQDAYLGGRELRAQRLEERLRHRSGGPPSPA